METLERLADFAEEKISWKHLRIPDPMRLDQRKLVDAVKAGFNPLCYLYQIAQGVPHSVLVKIDVRNTSGDVI